ncbi:hypothetical protein [Mycobacterium sp. SMC-14]|uniref:hypothetical protein n=1 Tax=Mycobacterium sp. SMC-14 TaxID=3385968 RepID=UPI00390C4164
MAAVRALLTLSQVQALDTSYLRDAADHWERTANLWEESFTDVHQRVSAPGGTPWTGFGNEGAQQRTYGDMVKVRTATDQLHRAIEIARHSDQALQFCKREVLSAVREANDNGFDVGEDYSVTDRSQASSPEHRAARQTAAQEHASFIRHKVAALATKDNEIATQIASFTEGVGILKFDDGEPLAPQRQEHGIQLVGNGIPLPQAPHPAPEPPPGGWSNDPLMRAAQKIAYGHAGRTHIGEFPGMTRDQLAETVYDLFKRSAENPGDLVLGRTPDGAPVLYDPKANVMVIRDPKGLDAGTVYKPKVPNLQNYLDRKIPTRLTSIATNELSDGPLPTAGGTPGGVVPSENAPSSPKTPGRPPVEALPAPPTPSTKSGGGGPLRLPAGGGLPWDSPAAGPRPVYLPDRADHPPVLGEDQDENPLP